VCRLMQTSKACRALVAEHVLKATFALNVGRNRMDRAALHAMASRPGSDLELILVENEEGDGYSSSNSDGEHADFDRGKELGEILSEAVMMGGWAAVKTLHLEGVPLAEHGHLVGAACPALHRVVLQGNIPGFDALNMAFFSGLARCSALSTLELYTKFTPSALQQVQLLPKLLPAIRHLVVVEEDGAEGMVVAFASQLTSLAWWRPRFESRSLHWLPAHSWPLWS